MIQTSVLRAAPPKARIHSMDELRGFAVLCMVFYHAFYSAAFLLGWQWGKVLLSFFTPAEPYFAGLFILISGISSQLSHSNLIRGLKLLAVAVCVTLVTGFFLPDQIIRFGILHMLSICMISFGLVQKAFEHIPALLGILVFAALFAIFYGFNGAFGFTTTFDTQFLFPSSIPDGRMYSADYFPIIPWLLLFYCGTFLGRYAREGLFPKFLYPSRIPALSFLGRHALLIYIVHQPVIYGVMLAVQFFLNQVQ